MSRTKKEKLYRCPKGHFFKEEKCPHCGGPRADEIEKRSGDCFFCGMLCPDGAYGCDTPDIVHE